MSGEARSDEEGEAMLGLYGEARAPVDNHKGEVAVETARCGSGRVKSMMDLPRSGSVGGSLVRRSSIRQR
ncbi:hypothetical protein M6B38_345445 [Iris pallida]|uniref:Uncharacterized protein n=1 Tax=Iris pallida TaxID=29817 RepID=A0AAX6EWV4_IRIPA|nr:hypothetical protein M6B38_167850 [Iris pallida]KAJ6832078.1 hypothetical protein M6B38_345445 [Iris pallida]